jgi:hypothetical protein
VIPRLGNTTLPPQFALALRRKTSETGLFSGMKILAGSYPVGSTDMRIPSGGSFSTFGTTGSGGATLKTNGSLHLSRDLNLQPYLEQPALQETGGDADLLRSRSERFRGVDVGLAPLDLAAILQRMRMVKAV